MKVGFESKIVGGSVPKYIPGVEKGFKDQSNAGTLAGFPLIDNVWLVDNKTTTLTRLAPSKSQRGPVSVKRSRWRVSNC